MPIEPWNLLRLKKALLGKDSTFSFTFPLHHDLITCLPPNFYHTFFLSYQPPPHQTTLPPPPTLSAVFFLLRSGNYYFNFPQVALYHRKDPYADTKRYSLGIQSCLYPWTSLQYPLIPFIILPYYPNCARVWMHYKNPRYTKQKGDNMPKQSLFLPAGKTSNRNVAWKRKSHFRL